MDQFRRTIAGVLVHPNVSAALIVGLGCEVNQIDWYLGAGLPRTDRLMGMTLQESGGTRATVEAARRQIAGFIERAAAERRTPAPASRIVLGLNCGGSDSFSGITANPALGYCSDLLAELGGTPVLAETPEIVGAEHLLVKRARNRAVAEKLLGFIAKYKEYLNRFGGSFDDNPSPGNKEGGLTNILEKSLGAVAKGGTTNLQAVYEYAQQVDKHGFVYMDTPGYDPVSATGQVAGGANMICFTTGRGSAYGCAPSPSLKLATNTALWQRQEEDMDINCGEIIDGRCSIQEMGERIFRLVLATASGEPSKSEQHGYGQNEFVPWQIGAVM
jgi:altronate hydrolase